MNIKEELDYYINCPETTGALLLTGKWGCGKSYLVKEIAEEYNNNKKAAVAVISLFGLDSVHAINKRVKDEYINFTLGKNAKKIATALKKITKEGTEIVGAATDLIPAASVISRGVSAFMNVDLFELVRVDHTIEKGNKIIEFVLVFDDLERSNLETKDLLGVLNEYVENKKIKVIIVADEEKIKKDEYKEYKEKLISRTIRMSADYELLITSLIDNYSETAEGYKMFLSENKDLLYQVFVESRSDNLRTLKTAIADFERIYTAWVETNTPTENMKWALYTFTAEMFISKDTTEKSSEESKDTAFGYYEEEAPQYLYKWKMDSSFAAFDKWIKNGIWEKDTFVKELENKYSKKEITPLEKFLRWYIFSLEQKDIDEGLPIAVQSAYKGELSSQDLIVLLEKIHILNQNSIKLPCDVDYKMIENGLDKRIAEIKNGNIDEPPCRMYALENQVDEEAVMINKKIENIERQIKAWEYRRDYINYINGNTMKYSFYECCIDEFDDELFSNFKTQYSLASNEKKNELANSLLRLRFNTHYFSDNNNIETTRNNFKKMINWLEQQKSDDCITTVINKLFASELQNTDVMKTNL